MTALAWPVVALVIGLCAARIAWEAVAMQRRRVAEVAEALGRAMAHRDELAGIVEAERDLLRSQVVRIAELEQWRVTLRNRNGGRD